MPSPGADGSLTATDIVSVRTLDKKEISLEVNWAWAPGGGFPGIEFVSSSGFAGAGPGPLARV